MATTRLEIAPETLWPGAPQRFYNKVRLGDQPDACHLWTGYLRDSGYGEISINNKTQLVHRYAYELANGPIPENHDIDHVRKRGCTSRACVNPAHLEAVDHAENMHRQGDASPQERSRLPERLEKHKLTSETAAAAGRKSGEARRLKRARLEAQRTSEHNAVTIIATAPVSDLSVRVKGASVQILDALLTGDIPIRNGKEASDLLATLHGIQRLEEGQPTSLGVNVTGSVSELRDRLSQRLEKPQAEA